jgi:hypothetical protein
LRRLILQCVNSTRYGCTVSQLAYLIYGVGRGDGLSDAQVAAVDRAVRRLLDDERVVERAMLGTERYLFPASPVMRGSALQTLECLDCDLRWVSEQGAPHLHCWSCGEPGKPATSRTGRRLTRLTGAVNPPP